MLFESTDIVVLAVLSSCWIIQILYYWIYLAKPYYHRRKGNQAKITFHPDAQPVSVIIYARNEAKNLEKYLPAILEQNYPQYEVIVVNDCSIDDTEDILRRIITQYKHIYCTYVPPETKSLSRKKLALTIGIKAAHYSNLLFLDADSCPVSPDWLRLMAQHFSEQKNIVLGFSALGKKPSLYAAYDYFFSNLQMMALALMNRACTGNGKNLAYNKNELAWQQAFSDFSFLEAGEDDLLVSKLAQRGKVAVEVSSDSLIRVNMDKRWMWQELKVKRMTTLPFYKAFPIVFWMIEKISRLLFYFMFVFVCVWFYPDWMKAGIGVAFFLTRFLTQWIVVNRTTKLLKLPKFHFNLLIFDIIQPFVNVYFYLDKIFQSKPKEYKKYGK